MSQLVKTTSINRILSKIKRNYNNDDLSESDLIEWAGEALDFLNTDKVYKETVGFLKIENYQVEIPAYLHAIIQIAKNNCFIACDSENDIKEKDLCPKDVCEIIEKETEQECNKNHHSTAPVCLDCEGRPINDYNVAYYRPYFDLIWDYQMWNGSSLYRNCFTPVRLSTNTMFNNMTCELANKHLESTCKDEYNIIGGSILRFNFEKGQVAVSYLKQILDDEGYPMIPDNIESVTAITKYIILKVSERNFYNNRDGSESRLQYAAKDWQWYCRQAKNKNREMSIDDYENLLQQRSYLLPKTNHYNNFFGNLNTRESKRYNDPNFRNINNTSYSRTNYGR